MIKIISSRVTVDGLLMEGEEPSSIINIEPESACFPISNLKYKIKVSLVSGGFLVTGSASIVFRCSCDNCLSEFDLKIVNNEICHLYEKEKACELDLTEDIREDILISLPHRFLCKKECEGFCFNCGQNLNLKRCSCSQRKDQNLEWDKLNRLNF